MMKIFPYFSPDILFRVPHNSIAVYTKHEIPFSAHMASIQLT